MPYFPMFIDLKDKPVLIVGGGAVALRKLEKLRPYGPALTVVAPEISPEIEAAPDVTVRHRAFQREDLCPPPAMVIAATDDRETNHTVAALCREKNIPVNVADDPAACTFLFPALVQQGEFSAGISTGGASPTAAAYFKDRLRRELPEDLDAMLDWLASRRPALKAAIPDQRARSAAFRALFEACMAKGTPLTAAEEAACLSGAAPMGSVALVGAGCGRADLITVRGLELLRRCDAVVYDDLIDPALLDAAPESARRIYMGKRSGAHSAPQSEICETLIALAREGLRVVRLKGGDPYLFGRGGEEMLALRAAGVPCQEVPGIPSPIGIPAEAGIPVTHRGVSRGLHIVTAYTADTPDGLPEDFDALAGLSGTLVFLMGLAQLPKITRRLMAAGKPGSTPAAVVSGGNAPHPVTVRATLSTLEQAAQAAGVTSPAVILVGDTAAMNLNAPPLSGVTVGITGTKTVAAKQIAALEALGARTCWVSRSEITDRPVTLPPTEKRRWLVFTSANGVRSFFRQADPASVRDCRFAVIGPATGEVLARAGLRADLCPGEYTSEALAAALAEAASPDEEIVLLRSAAASPVLPDRLRAAGFSVTDLPVYDMTDAAAPAGELTGLDYLTFSSAGGVDRFFRQYAAVPDETKCVCIGPVTARALAKRTARPFLTAPDATVSGLVAAILGERNI